MPRTRCSLTCSIVEELTDSFKDKLFFFKVFNWCFWRVVITILFVLLEFKITRFALHQMSILLREFCSTISTSSIVLALTWTEESSANRSHLVLSFSRHRGRSLM